MGEMRPEIAPDFASLAALIGEPARAAMLWSLMAGQQRPAGELARIAGISAQSASGHLGRLVDGGLLEVRSRGKNRFYRLSGPETAQTIESLAALAACAPKGGRVVSLVPKNLRHARSCWGHLAGALGVELHDALIAAGWLSVEGDRYALTAEGQSGFRGLGVDLSDVRGAHRGIAFPCLDWSERLPHLGGPLARRLLTALMARGWFTASLRGRELTLTPKGRDRMAALIETLSGRSAAARSV
jgi:DNA-binding transcriptional ArsR family regulator